MASPFPLDIETHGAAQESRHHSGSRAKQKMPAPGQASD